MSVDTILLVDDSKAIRTMLENHLVAAGYAVKLAADGTEALKLFQETLPILVLLDIVMPDMDGYEICRRIRGLPLGVDVPIVFLTALSDLQSHQKAMEAGGDDLIPKPINRSELLMRVRSMSWMHRLRTELRNGYNLIRSQRDALVSAQQRKDELTNLIVHDLKNPLTNIIGHSDFIEDQADMDPKTVREMVRSMGSSARVMMRMVMNMLDIMRSEDGMLQPKMASVDVPELLDGLKRSMAGLILKKKITLTVSKALTAEKVSGDPDLLRRTLDNLVDNAIRSAPSGSAIAVEARTVGVNVEIRVRDQGPGVPAEHRENIFDKYVQLGREDPTHPRSNLGLGLTFCRLAVEAHNGRIWVEDNQPQGACFCLQLPCDAAVKPADGAVATG